MSATLQTTNSFVGETSSHRKTLRVLHVTEASCAGVGGHVLDLVEGLPLINCDVHLIYSPGRADEPFLGRIKKNTNARFQQIEMRRMPGIKDINLARKIATYERRNGPFDIIHAHSTKAGGLTRMPFVRFQGKNVYTPNGIFTMNPTLGVVPRFMAKRIELALANKSQAIVAVSPEEKQHMLEIGMPETKVKFIANGIVDRSWPDKTITRKALGLDPGSIIVGFLGRLANQKNPLLMIEAFAKMDPGPNVRLAMVGTGPLAAKCKQLSKTLGIESRIDWLGFKTAEQAMPAFDMFVMPSQYEGMPYVMMEAMSIGMPIIATEVGGTSIGIEPGVNGYIVKRGDATGLAYHMQKLAENQLLRHQFAKASKCRALQFSVAEMVRQTKSLYDSLVSENANTENQASVN